MRTRFIAVGAAVLALLTSVIAMTQSAQAATGLHVSGTKIVEANGSQFVMRGISHAHTWYASQTSSFAEHQGARRQHRARRARAAAAGRANTASRRRQRHLAVQGRTG